jgi:hypothetical protein
MTDKDKPERREGTYFAPGRRRQRKVLMIIIPAVVAVIALAVVGSMLYTPAPVEAVDGIQCNSVEVFNYHVHSHLDVFVGGQSYAVPASIGIPNNKCFYWLHTHSTDGVIHIEAPRQMNFTLGQFLDVWEKTHPDQQLSTAISSGPVTAYVNGVKYSGDYKGIELQSRSEIALVIGKSPDAAIPATYPSSAPPS